VYKLLLTAMLALAVGATGTAAQDGCAPNWTSDRYRSYGDIQAQIKQQYGDVRVLRVALCGQGGNAYFRVVIISGGGEVKRLQLPAAK